MANLNKTKKSKLILGSGAIEARRAEGAKRFEIFLGFVLEENGPCSAL